MAADQRAIATLALVESPAALIRKIEVLKGECYYDADFAKTAIDPAKSYNAVFAVKRAQLIVKFNLNGKGSAIIPDQPLDKDPNSAGLIVKPADPSAAGYDFGGWYKEATCENAWDFDDAIDFSDPQPDEMTLYAKWVEKTLPASALSGKFSVSNDGGTTIKQVHFSQGNLYWDGSAFKFEANQYSGTSYANNHVSHFYWSKDASVAYAEGYNVGSASESDVFFTNETETTSKDGFTVNVGGTEQTGWRTLSTNEWKYLFNTRTVNGGQGAGKSYSLNITYGGKMGLVLYPDDYSGSTLTSGTDYTDANFPADCVFLPAAGFRRGFDIYDVGGSGRYWSSTAFDSDDACYVLFFSYNVFPVSFGHRYIGYSVRLITECQ